MNAQMTPRSFTFFASRTDMMSGGQALLKDMLATARRMEAAYAAPRTLRLTLPAIDLDRSEDLDMDLALSGRWYQRAREVGFRWVNQPLHLSGPFDDKRYTFHVISSMLSKYEGMFSSINIRSQNHIIDGAESYAALCKSLSRRDYRGFSNFRLGVGFNIVDYTPFFPFSDGAENGVSVALESLPLVRAWWNETRNMDAVADALHQELLKAEMAFTKAIGDGLLRYHGADWSLAPLPNGPESVTHLVEDISGNPIGSGGTLTAIANLTGCLQAPAAGEVHEKAIKAAGFNGVMLSVLEDDVLANRFLHRSVSVNDLLLYSSVCGCGLDMLPIAGDTPEVAIAEYAGDTGHMAFRLNKPLGVRLLPIERLRAGQKTEFCHDFVCNSAVVSL